MSLILLFFFKTSMVQRILKIIWEEMMIVNTLAVFVLNTLILQKIMLYSTSNQSIFQTLLPTSVLNVKRYVIQGRHFKFIKVEITNIISLSLNNENKHLQNLFYFKVLLKDKKTLRSIFWGMTRKGAHSTSVLYAQR